MESGHVSHALFLESHPVSYDYLSATSPSTTDRLAIFPSTPIAPSLFLPIIFIQKFYRNISTFSPCTLPHCAGSPVEMHAANIPSGCEECVTECDVETCDLATENSQCTDRCLVVPCEDPCPDVCASACGSWSASPCETALCQGFHDLSGHCSAPPQGIHPFTQLPSHLVMQHERGGSDHLDWNDTSLSRELDALICACTTQSQPHSFDSNTCDPRLLSVTKSNSHSHHHSSIPRALSQMSASDTSGPVWFSPIMSATASARSSPGPSSPSTSDTQQLHTPEIGPRMDIEAFQSHSSDNIMCLWAQCGMTFRSSFDLISHVNAAHLHLPIPPKSFPHQIVSQHHSYPSVQQNPTSIACMWGDCNVYPTPSHIPGPSSGNMTHTALGLLASHLLQDHLGVSIPHSFASKAAHAGPRTAISNTIPNDSARFHAPSNDSASVVHTRSPPLPSQPLASSSSSVVAQSAPHHVCKWQRCVHAQTIFHTSTELTMHITDVHVGGGKNRYDCMWEGCSRHGTSGFSSKQKILRHIQSHTGHRPFRCETCDQLFSEAATLQQHMRRHTKEKPYICDFAGCTKAFAITGALTIHKRTHSGKKPFKCTYCERSFSESSNLSKHVRTHTGDRPYSCSHPGCEKRFARPDQVARHMNVHTRKRPIEGAATGDIDEVANVQDG